MQIIDHYGIKNVSAFAKEYLGYDSPEKINRLRKEGKYPSFEILTDIANKFDKVDLDWLITGKGKMLKAPDKNTSFTVSEPQEIYHSYAHEEVIFLRDHAIKLQEDNSRLIQIIQQLTVNG